MTQMRSLRPRRITLSCFGIGSVREERHSSTTGGRPALLFELMEQGDFGS